MAHFMMIVCHLNRVLRLAGEMPFGYVAVSESIAEAEMGQLGNRIIYIIFI